MKSMKYLVATFLAFAPFAVNAATITLDETSSNEEIKEAFETSGTVQLAGDIDIVDLGITISDTVEIVLDLAGYDIIANNVNGSNIYVDEGGKLTLMDSTDIDKDGGEGKIYITEEEKGIAGLVVVYGEFIMESGEIYDVIELTDENGDYLAGNYGLDVYGNAIINGGSIEAYYEALYIEDGSVTINAGTFKAYIYDLVYVYGGTLEINGGEFINETEGYSIYLYETTSVKISNVTIDIYMKESGEEIFTFENVNLIVKTESELNKGLYFEGINKVIISEDMVIEEDYIIESGKYVEVAEGVTVTFEKTLTISGTLENNGTVIVEEVIKNEDALYYAVDENAMVNSNDTIVEIEIDEIKEDITPDADSSIDTEDDNTENPETGDYVLYSAAVALISVVLGACVYLKIKRS